MTQIELSDEAYSLLITAKADSARKGEKNKQGRTKSYSDLIIEKFSEGDA